MMNCKLKYFLSIGTVFIWIGFVAAISFMEAWLKFQAPGVTVPIGLGIGSLVFAALNKVEWILFVIYLISSFRIFIENKTQLFIIVVLGVILLIQTFDLLPQLDARAQLHINGESVPASNLHILFIVAECVKVFVLMLLSSINLHQTFKYLKLYHFSNKK